MSSIYKRGNRWYAKVKDAHGKWRAFATTATTKRAARKLASDLETQFERQRRGLDPMDDEAGLTVGEVLSWYVETFLAGKPSYKTTKASIAKHIEPTLGDVPLADLTAAAIEKLLDKKEKELSPQTLNHLRGYISRAINKAKSRGKWHGENVATLVESRRVPKRIYDWLRTEEVPPLMEALDERFRPYFATALYTGLRKGELAGLRKSDVDLKARLLFVRRSYDRDTTKGGHADAIPIAPALVPWLEEAIRNSPSELVFPGPSGEMLRRDFKAAAIFQRALGRAGIVDGYEHVCRRRGCGHKEVRQDADQRRCPVDNRLLWPKALPRKLRFHDLRGTCASLLFEAGVQIDLIAAVLRHSDPKLTRERYAHMAPDFLAAVVEKMDFGLPANQPESDEAEAERAVAGSSGLVTPLVQDEESPKKSPETEAENASNPGAFVERAMGLEPTALSLGSGSGEFQSVSESEKTSETEEDSDDREPPLIQRGAAFASSFVTSLVPRRLRVLDGRRDQLLTVRQVAEQLSVSTHTVYSLASSGKLPHVRLSNAIRVRPADLRSFIDAQRKGGAS